MSTFMGGIHPNYSKITADSPIVKAKLPKVVILPLSQHIGAPAKAIVIKGDYVKVGQKVAEAGGFVSDNSNTRSILMGNGIWTILDYGFYVWNFEVSTNLNLDAEGSTIDYTEDRDNKIFYGGSLSYNDIIMRQTTYSARFSGNNYFNTMTLESTGGYMYTTLHILYR